MSGRPNKRMKLTKLSAAPGWLPTTVRTEAPPRAREASMDAGTASQLIRGVGLTSVERGNDPGLECRATRRRSRLWCTKMGNVAVRLVPGLSCGPMSSIESVSRGGRDLG
jgi:hypothetical protein